MAKSKVSHKLIPTEEREMTDERQTASNTAAEFELPKLNKDDWKKVEEKVKYLDKSWSRAVDEVKAENLQKKHGDNALLVIIHEWPQLPEYQRKPDQLKPDQLKPDQLKPDQLKPDQLKPDQLKPESIPSLEYLISRLTKIILESDTEGKYEFFVDEESASEPTLLHLAAEQNFFHVSRMLVNRYPSLVNSLTEEGKDSVLPVELALREHNDDTAAYLISQMQYDRIQDLFLFDESKEEDPVKFYFGDIISWGMKKTVIAILNKLIDPHWPYLPDREGKKDDENKDKIQWALESVPDDPLNYDFYYHILETDEDGRQPKMKMAELDECGKPLNPEWVFNPNFNQKSVSCLRRIADSDNKEAVQHPVVRMLVAKKWNKFAQWFCIKAAFYVLFLAVLSFALVYGSTRDDPTQYEGSADKFRAFCEICSIIFLMVHLFEEIDDIARERRAYFEVCHNYFDLLGIILTLLVLPLRFAEVKSQWSFAALGYILNFLRLFKFSNVTRTTGLYTTTIVKIIQRDISRFMAFFFVIFIGFCGAMYMALKVDNLQDSYRFQSSKLLWLKLNANLLKYSNSNFAWLMLAGFRALAEQQSLEEDYQKFGWLTILILLCYMGTVLVVLLNVLIAQLSYTYSETKKMARLQYAADTMRIVTRLECSRFASWTLRVKNYKEGAYISDEDLAKELLEFDEERHPWETVEERITAVRETMRRVMRKGKEKDPLETIDEKLTTLTLLEKETRETIDEKLKAIMEKRPKSKRNQSV